MALAVDLGSIAWGDVPTWLGSVLTSGALLFAVATYRRSENRAVRSQASHIHLLMTHFRSPEPEAPGTEVYEVRARNNSTAPIYNVILSLAAPDARSNDHAFSPHLDVGEELGGTLSIHLDERPRREEELARANVTFRDADGFHWQRWSSGHLYPPIDLRPRKGWRRITRVVPGRWRVRWASRPSRPALRGD